MVSIPISVPVQTCQQSQTVPFDYNLLLPENKARYALTSDAAAPMTSQEAILRPSQEQSSETVQNDEHDDVLISGLGTALDDKNEPWSSEPAAVGNEQEPLKQKSSQIITCCTYEEDMIAWVVMFVAKVLVRTELSTMLKSSLVDILSSFSALRKLKLDQWFIVSLSKLWTCYVRIELKRG